MEGTRILIVDDDEVARKNISRILSKVGYRVSAAKDGAGALAQLLKGGAKT